MITLSNDFKNEMKTHKVVVTFRNDDIGDITESDIVQGSLTIDKSCVTGTSLEIGTAIAKEITVQLRNDSNIVGDNNFYGLEFDVIFSCGGYLAPSETYTVTDVEYQDSIVELHLMDNMIKFDKRADWSALESKVIQVEKEYGRTDIASATTIADCGVVSISSVWVACCRLCGVPCDPVMVNVNGGWYETTPDHLDGSSTHPFGNNSMIKGLPTDETCTYRDIIRWIAGATGRIARISNNKLYMFHYHWNNLYYQTPVEINDSNSYILNISKDDIKIGGITMTIGDRTYSSSDMLWDIPVPWEDGINKIDLSDNPMMPYMDFGDFTEDEQRSLILRNAYMKYVLTQDDEGVVKNFSYRKFNATILGDFTLEAGDGVLLGADKIPSVITNVTYTHGGSTHIEGKLNASVTDTSTIESTSGKILTIEDTIKSLQDEIAKLKANYCPKLKVGDTYDLYGMWLHGTITSGKSAIYINVPLGGGVSDEVSSAFATTSTLLGKIRQNSSYIIGNGTDQGTINIDSVSITRNRRNLTIKLDVVDTSNVPMNNSGCEVYINALLIKFS